MADLQTTQLQVKAREANGSREARRLRRDRSACPAYCTAVADAPISFDVDARELRLALARSGAVLDLSIDGGEGHAGGPEGGSAPPSTRRRPTHVDLLRVRLDKADPRGRDTGTVRR